MYRLKGFLSILAIFSILTTSAYAETVSVSSQNKDYAAEKAINGDENTFWHTEYKPLAEPPHWIVVDLGKVQAVSGLSYLPRQDGNSNGYVSNYNVYISKDNKTFTKVASGTWEWKLGPEKREISFEAVNARYVKLEAPDDKYMAVADITVSAQEPATVNPATGDVGVSLYVLLAVLSAVGIMVISKRKLIKKA